MNLSKSSINGIEVLTGENQHIRFKIAPELGGKILSIYNKNIRKEFLWTNGEVPFKAFKPDDDYDSNFLGGIDELLPNDIPEKIDSIAFPDHGELWTTPLRYEYSGNSIMVSGMLPLSNLFYKKSVCLDERQPVICLNYYIRNDAPVARHFLWKLHAALAVEAGDRLLSSARKARAVSPEASRFKTSAEFNWPLIGGCDVSIVPPYNGTLDFFYLYDIDKARMQLLSNRGRFLFSYEYDKKIFPYQWYFASSGGFLKHYTVILEPASAMPVSVNEAQAAGQCTVLEPGQEINTTVRIYAGEALAAEV